MSKRTPTASILCPKHSLVLNPHLYIQMSEGDTEIDDESCPYTIGSFHTFKGELLDWMWKDEWFIAVYLDGGKLSMHGCSLEQTEENEKKVRRLLSRRWIAVKFYGAIRYVAGEDQVPVAGKRSGRAGE